VPVGEEGTVVVGASDHLTVAYGVALAAALPCPARGDLSATHSLARWRCEHLKSYVPRFGVAGNSLTQLRQALWDVKVHCEDARQGVHDG
jgi:hypothetical protein